MATATVDHKWLRVHNPLIFFNSQAYPTGVLQSTKTL